MAKKDVITRRSTSLNLNTGSRVKTANKYAGGSGMEKTFEKVPGIISGVSGILGAYNANNQVGNTAKYDSELNTLEDSVSIGNYDALSDWYSNTPTYTHNFTYKDFDSGMSGWQKMMNVGSGAIAGLGAGMQTGNPYVAAAAALIGGGAAGAGLLTAKARQKDLAREYNILSNIAEGRKEAMFSHELQDIQEKMKNLGMENLASKGGSIDISPSKRGTFKAQATKMGMSVSEAAKHILAHKENYSPEMVKKANFANNFAHAYGGQLFEDGGALFNYPVEYNHGGYFSLDPELIKINQGGTHEMNPLEGVPMGFDENGIPNLVEEGETIYDNYVFSNRLAPKEEQLASGGLPTKYKDHTFADISAKIAKQFEETPNDEIAKESMKEAMQRLRTIQEEVRTNQEAEDTVNSVNDFAFAPEEQQQQMLEQQPQQMPEEMQEIPAEQPAFAQGVPEGMEQYPIEQPPMMAFGGNLFSIGAGLDGLSDEERKSAEKRAATIASLKAEKGTPAYSYYYDEALKSEISYFESRKKAEKEASERAKNLKAPSIALSPSDEVIKAGEYLRSRGYTSATSGFDPETEAEYYKILRGDTGATSGTSSAESSTAQSSDAASDPAVSQVGEEVGPATSRGVVTGSGETLKSRDTSGVAGTAKRQGVHTTEYNEGTTAEQKRAMWFNSSGKALMDSLDDAKKYWDKKGLKGAELRAEKLKYLEAMNAVQDAYAKAYRAGYDPSTGTANYDDAVKALQEIWDKNKGNKYFDQLVKGITTKGDTGDNSAKGWIDGIWGAITENRNWGLTEYFDPSQLSGYSQAERDMYNQIMQKANNAGITWTPGQTYGDKGYKAYKFGLQEADGKAATVDDLGRVQRPEDGDGLILNGKFVPKAEIEAANAKGPAGGTGGGKDDERKLLPTWMRYAPIVGAGLSAIWDIAQQPDYSVAEATERMARNVPRARFNPIGNYLTYRPLDRNFYLNQVRNQGLATDRALLNSAGANQGAATAALLASQYNTQSNIGNSLMQQELANRQNEQQVAQFNRGTDQYNSQGLFNESIYNQRAGMQRGQYALTAAQLRQAERQRRNAAISADLTNLFQGIGDLGWENMNINMVNGNRANMGYGITKSGDVTYKKGGMLTKKKSRRK